jgi:hypothetical protein
MMMFVKKWWGYLIDAVLTLAGQAVCGVYALTISRPAGLLDSLTTVFL